jgi:lipoprotein signal peptidase
MLKLYTNFGIQYSMVSGENGLFVWVYRVVGLRLDFGIQYSMVSGKNGLFVWVYSVVRLRLDFGIQYSVVRMVCLYGYIA